jgi:hypothetical protein
MHMATTPTHRVVVPADLVVELSAESTTTTSSPAASDFLLGAGARVCISACVPVRLC